MNGTDILDLRQSVEDHERRITALEARLDPKTREQIFNAALDDLLDELAGETEGRRIDP